MRLIDADRLPLVGQECPDRPIFFCVMKESLDMAETIDAIPVQYVREEIVGALFDGKVGSNAVKTVFEIIARWRKQNDRRGTD